MGTFEDSSITKLRSEMVFWRNPNPTMAKCQVSPLAKASLALPSKASYSVKKLAFRSKLALRGEKNLVSQGEPIQLAFNVKILLMQKR